jgi:hypothetical protein
MDKLEVFPVKSMEDKSAKQIISVEENGTHKELQDIYMQDNKK